MLNLEKEKAQIMFKLTRKNNWDACYDRLEHFKRFQNLDQCLKELQEIGWVIIHKKPNYTAISLNTKFKREIIDFVEKYLPELQGIIR